MSSGKYQLTCAKQSDANDIFVLEEASFPPDEAASFETICDRMSEAGKFFYTYRSENGELVGFINGTCIVGPKILHESMTNHEPLGRILVIHSVTIKESMRRLKLGTRMLREYITRMKDELSIDQILLLSKANMLTFYVDCGFHLGCLSDVCHGQDKWFEMRMDLKDIRAVEQLQVDAFTPRAFGGNQAAVIFEHRGVEWMQNVAMENNFAETSFVAAIPDKEGCFSLRWFTPTVEVELCGHATLAAAHALYETKHVAPTQAITFQTIHSGELQARMLADGTIELNFPVTEVTPVQLSPDLKASLLLALDMKEEDVLSTGKSIYDLVVEVRREAFARLASTAIDFGKIAEQGGRAVLVTCVGGARGGLVDLSALKATPPRTPQAAVVNDPKYDFLSRAFVPRYGINEDPVTGSAHCALAPYWTDKFSTTEQQQHGELLQLTGYQASGRGGEVRVAVEGDRVRLGGHCVTTARAKVLV